MTQDTHTTSDDIITLCQQSGTALQAIHAMMTHGKITERALSAIYQRVLTDNDADGAYYLASLAQKNDDLPFDVLPLIELVLSKGDDVLKVALLDKLPKSAIIQLKQTMDLSFYQLKS